MINEYEMEERFSKLASLIGEKVRAKMLWHLLDGRAYTALELAIIADISKQSCSNHLKKLIAEKILAVEKQGRHKYFRLYDKEVAKALEGLAFLTSQKIPEKKLLSTNAPLSGIKYARSCYNHLAGYLGVSLQKGFLDKGLIEKKNNHYQCTKKEISTFLALGIDTEELKLLNRKFAYPCLDWSERAHHIGGALGAALLKFMLTDDWLRKKENSRELILTSKGQQQLANNFQLKINTKGNCSE